MRALEEKAAMQRRIAEGVISDRKSSVRLRDQSAADDSNARVIRDMIFARDSELRHAEFEQGSGSDVEKTA